MFGFFRRKEKQSPLEDEIIAARQQVEIATEIATMMPIANSIWKKCVDESAASNGGVRLSRITAWSIGDDSWEGVARRFLNEFVRIDPRLNANDELRTKLGMYLNFIENFVLPNNYLFTEEELEQIGEFIAVAAVCGLKVAIMSDVERASLVFDLLPREWVVGVGLVPEKFDDHYYKITGKRRKHRE